MNIIHMAAAALSSTPLGAPNVVTISNDSSSGVNGRDAGIIFKTNGQYAKLLHGVPIVQSNWLHPQSNTDQYEIYCTVTGDALTTGTPDSWLPLSSDQEFTIVSDLMGEALSSGLVIEIRWTGNNVVQDTAVYSLTAGGPIS